MIEDTKSATTGFIAIDKLFPLKGTEGESELEKASSELKKVVRQADADKEIGGDDGITSLPEFDSYTEQHPEALAKITGSTLAQFRKHLGALAPGPTSKAIAPPNRVPIDLYFAQMKSQQAIFVGLKDHHWKELSAFQDAYLAQVEAARSMVLLYSQHPELPKDADEVVEEYNKILWDAYATSVSGTYDVGTIGKLLGDDYAGYYRLLSNSRRKLNKID